MTYLKSDLQKFECSYDIVNCCYPRNHCIVWQDMSTHHGLEYRYLKLEICATGNLSKQLDY